MRTPLLAANWKMHKTVHESVAFVRELESLVRPLEGVEVVVAPPFTAVAAAAEAARHGAVGVAGQDVSFESSGAFTGEISAGMLKDAGADWVIVGHSERRRLFGETDADVQRKLTASRGEGLDVIMCVGETLAQREQGETLAVLDRQLRVGLEHVDGGVVAELVIAYEPVWAIGTGKQATPAEADEAHRHIRAHVTQRFGADPADRCRILYGGSVTPGNIADLIALPDVDGALVGGAGLKIDSFFEIIQIAAAGDGG
jgi:triosephosphate isomerase